MGLAQAVVCFVNTEPRAMDVAVYVVLAVIALYELDAYIDRLGPMFLGNLEEV